MSVIIPDTVISIGGGAFYNCTSLSAIEIPYGVETVGGEMLCGCTSLTSLVVPDSVTSIGGAFVRGCTNLQTLSVPFIGRNRDSIQNNAVLGIFFGCTTVVSTSDKMMGSESYEFYDKQFRALTSYYYYIPESLTTVIVTDATKISLMAFNGCTNIKNVVLNDGITEIGKYAFRDCTGLESVYYQGAAVDWSDINILDNNTDLTDATRYYYSATEPEVSGNFWYYDEDGNIAVW